MTIKNLAYCTYCRHEGEYGVEVVETDHRDITGRDTTICACRDTDACHVRTCLAYANALGTVLKLGGK